MRILLFCLFAVLFGCSIVEAEEEKVEEAQKGLAAHFRYDIGIKNHPAVIFASGFEEEFSGWALDARDRRISSIFNDPAIVHSGSRCCRSVAIRHKNTGGCVTYSFPKGEDQIFLRFYCRFDKDAVMPHHFVKIRAIRKGVRTRAGVQPLGDKAFWTGIEPLRDRTWRFYTYWHKMHSGRANPTGVKGDYYGNTFTVKGQPLVEREKWICVEAMVKANTVGKSDGEMAFWIDGKLTGWWRPGSPKGTWVRSRFVIPGPRPRPFEGFDFRTDSAVMINQIALVWYVTEKYAKLGKSLRNIVYFDDVVVARRYIGPMNIGKPTGGTKRKPRGGIVPPPGW